MLKFLLIILLIGFVLFRGLGLIMRYLFGNIVAQKPRGHQNHSRSHSQPKGSNVNVDYVPNGKEKLPADFKGGEYVDFEEVK